MARILGLLHLDYQIYLVIFIDYLQKGRTITGAYYAALLNRLVDEIKKKQLNLKKKKILFHGDDEPSHTSNIAQTKKHEFGFDSHPHLPYSSDLAPTIICSQTSRDGSVVGVLSRTKKWNEEQTDILDGLTNRIIWKAQKS